MYGRLGTAEAAATGCVHKPHSVGSLRRTVIPTVLSLCDVYVACSRKKIPANPPVKQQTVTPRHETQADHDKQAANVEWVPNVGIGAKGGDFLVAFEVTGRPRARRVWALPARLQRSFLPVGLAL